MKKARSRAPYAEDGAGSSWRIAAPSFWMKSAISASICSQSFCALCRNTNLSGLGSTKTIHVDVRLIAATHRDLQTMIRNNQFREDLFYRLNVCPIEIPPLRERREDIPLLVHYFVLRLSRQMQKRIKSVPKQAMEALVNADWPGNIRELGKLHRALRDLHARGRIECPKCRA